MLSDPCARSAKKRNVFPFREINCPGRPRYERGRETRRSSIRRRIRLNQTARTGVKAAPRAVAGVETFCTRPRV
jgi:hypothetical protein